MIYFYLSEYHRKAPIPTIDSETRKCEFMIVVIFRWNIKVGKYRFRG